ncbi:hypothetical protein SRHO_G00133450 [Serrasalmus rhombeus]
MGPLQRDVFLRLSLPIFFTAFLFFVDVFIETKSCHVDTGGQTFNFSSDTGSDGGNISHQSNASRHINGSVCTVEGSFAYGQATYMTGLLFGSIFGGMERRSCWWAALFFTRWSRSSLRFSPTRFSI